MSRTAYNNNDNNNTWQQHWIGLTSERPMSWADSKLRQRRESAWGESERAWAWLRQGQSECVRQRQSECVRWGRARERQSLTERLSSVSAAWMRWENLRVRSEALGLGLDFRTKGQNDVVLILEKSKKMKKTQPVINRFNLRFSGWTGRFSLFTDF